MYRQPIMIQGTSSHAGKSTIVTGLCRFFAKKGLKVAPFKSQNMSLNSFATLEGEEISRSVAVQSSAAFQKPSVHMNPILLKPKSDVESQVIIHGKVLRDAKAMDFFFSKVWHEIKLEAIQESIHYLKNNYDLIIAEGAGSCAEPNLRSNDLVNMGLAHLLDAEVYLLTDIDKGGVFADILGSLKVMDLTFPEDKALIKGILINKFRGDMDVLSPALNFIQAHAEIPVSGILPYIPDLFLEEEDRVKLKVCSNPEIDIAILYLPHISNSSDFNPLSLEKNVRVRFVKSPDMIGEPDLIIIPGTKNTIWDLKYIRKIGLEQEILSRLPNTPLMGICGGFEMMGKALYDPHHIESDEDYLHGMNLFDFKVIFRTHKTVAQVEYDPSSSYIFKSAGKIQGYEVHCGEVVYGSCEPLFKSAKGKDGAIHHNPLIFGTFVHDLFKNNLFTRALINFLREKKGLNPLDSPLPNPGDLQEEQFEILAGAIQNHCSVFEKEMWNSSSKVPTS